MLCFYMLHKYGWSSINLIGAKFRRTQFFGRQNFLHLPKSILWFSFYISADKENIWQQTGFSAIFVRRNFVR